MAGPVSLEVMLDEFSLPFDLHPNLSAPRCISGARSFLEHGRCRRRSRGVRAPEQRDRTACNAKIQTVDGALILKCEAFFFFFKN